MSFFKRNKSSSNASNSASTKPVPAVPLTPLQLLLGDTPTKTDGSDKYFGFENYGNTCYCNSIMQCLYNSKPFREAVINYPKRSVPLGGKNPSLAYTNAQRLSRIVSEPPLPGSPAGKAKNGVVAGGTNLQRRGSLPSNAQPPNPNSLRLEDKDSPEYKKKMAMTAGPVLNVENSNNKSYGMEETLFSALKDLFESVVGSESRTGVVSPHRFIEVLKLKNELFRSQMHQDAHEFLNYVLNEVVDNVEEHYKKYGKANGIAPPLTPGPQEPLVPVGASNATSATSAGTAGWVHDLFEGALTSETKCLTCENVSRRDEPFLDLSIDLEKHSSVTSCLRNFSASEMLCERNKFHCDGCGGLQEAEKRMKIRRLPRILALHLKRFKYTEDLQRHQKLFHRVVYPYHLRLFNTTDDAEDPDRLYELYAVVVHIGGGPYHGHYVSIVKTEEKGWLLYDDEMVEPVDKSYVRNFFGDKPGLACAYVLFYQETTLEAIQKEGMAGRSTATQSAEAFNPVPVDMSSLNGTNGTHSQAPLSKMQETDEDTIDSTHTSTPEEPGTPLVKPLTPVAPISRVPTLPVTPIPTSPGPNSFPIPPIPTSPGPNSFSQRLSQPMGTPPVPASPIKSKKERERGKKEEKEREKAAKRESRSEKDDHHNHHDGESHGLRRFRPGSMSMSGKKAFAWASAGKDKSEKEKEVIPPTPQIPDHVLAVNTAAATASSDEASSQRSCTAPTTLGPAPVFISSTSALIPSDETSSQRSFTASTSTIPSSTAPASTVPASTAPTITASPTIAPTPAFTNGTPPGKEKVKKWSLKKDKHKDDDQNGGEEHKPHRLGLRKKLSILS